jgi:hypothetical protein
MRVVFSGQKKQKFGGGSRLPRTATDKFLKMVGKKLAVLGR